MKKLMMGVVIWAAAMAATAAAPATNVVDVVKNPGSVSISQCVSVMGNCNNPDLTVNLNGDGDNTVWINGKATVVNGKDGAAGRDGVDGKDGAAGRDGVDGKDGAQGIQGEQGIAGRDGVDGKDGLAGAAGEKGDKGDTGAAGSNGRDGEDGVTTTVVNNVVDSKTQNQVKQNTSRIERLEQQTSDNRKHASAGVAGVAAMANIPQVSQNSRFSIGAGVGSYDSEQGLAVGMSARFNGNIVTKASVSATTQHDFVVGAGVSYEW